MVSVSTIPGSKPMEIGEGPHWIEKDQALVYVNIPKGHIYRFFTETGRLQQLQIADFSSGIFTALIVPIEGTDDEFIIGNGSLLGWIKWPKSDPDFCTKTVVIVNSVDQGKNNRFNDGKCDPAGRLWAGTMAYETSPAVLPFKKGSLFRMDSNLSISTHATEITIANGLAWNYSKDKFYYIDSLDHSVDVFDYNNATGSIANRKKFFDYKKFGLDGEIPDGMCIDADDNLWVACFRGARVICIDPSGKILRQVEIPSLHVTSCCWGGKDYSTLYVTSAHLSLPKEEFTIRPDTGKTFAVTGLGVKGLPSVNFKFDPKELGKIREQFNNR